MAGKNYSAEERAQYWKDRALKGNSSNKGNFNNYQSNNSGKQYKSSGAKFTRIANGKFAGTGLQHIAAWRKTKLGLQTLSMNPLDGVEHVSQSNKTHLVYIGELVNKSMGTVTTVLGTYQKESGKLVLDKLGLVVSPNGQGQTKSGKSVRGYFGKFTR